MKAETSSSTAPREWTAWVDHNGFLQDGRTMTRKAKEQYCFDVVEKASLDRVVEERDELREALVLIRNYFPVVLPDDPEEAVPDALSHFDALESIARAALRSGVGGRHEG